MFSYPAGIDPQGTVAGTYSDANSKEHGFYRTADSTFTGFDGPDGCPPSSTSQPCATVAGINAGGTIVGEWWNGTGYDGFLMDSGAHLTTFAVPNAVYTEPQSINAAGEITGTYSDSNYNYYGFLRDTAGTFTIFDAPKSPGDPRPFDAGGTSINSQGEVLGSFATGSASLGLFRSRGGYFTVIDIPGAEQMFPTYIDDGGRIYGNYVDGTGSSTDSSATRPANIPSSISPEEHKITSLPPTRVGQQWDPGRYQALLPRSMATIA